MAPLDPAGVQRLIDALRAGRTVYAGAEDNRGPESVGGEVELTYADGRFGWLSRDWHAYNGLRDDERETRDSYDEAELRRALAADPARAAWLIDKV